MYILKKKKTTTTTINPPPLQKKNPDQVMLYFYLYLVLILFEAKFHEIKQCSIKGYKQEGILIVTHCNTLQRKLKYGLYVALKCFLQIRMSKLCLALLKTVIKPLFKSKYLSIAPKISKQYLRTGQVLLGIRYSIHQCAYSFI